MPGHSINQVRCRDRARHCRLPSARFGKVIYEQGYYQIRRNERAVAIQHSESISVTIRRKTEVVAAFYYRGAKLFEIFRIGLRAMAAEIYIAPVVQHLYFAVDILERFVQVTAPRAPQRVISYP